MFKQITSLQNPAIKRLIQLQEKSRNRKKEGGFVIEGKRELSLAIAGGYTITEIYFVQELIAFEAVQEIVPDTITQVSYTQISLEVYRKLAYRDSTEGILTFAKAKPTALSDLKLPQNPFILVAEAPEKPGNIGALLRTADAVNVDAVIIANPRTDLYNPNIIRSSVGCVFTNQVSSAPSEEVISYLKTQGINIFTAILQDAQPYHQQDYTQPTAIVVGTEADGLSEIWRTVEAQPVIIPMRGTIDSMNVSVAAGILLFEAQKQRGF